MTMTPESRQEPTAAQLIAIALGTSPPDPADVASSAGPVDELGEAMPPAPPTTPV